MNGTEEEKPKMAPSDLTASEEPTTGVGEPEAGGELAPVKTPLPSLTGDGLRVRYTGRSVVGLVREHNEDNLLIVNLQTGEISPREEICSTKVGANGMLFAVCDGMGGAAAGEIASQMAVDILHETMRRSGTPKDRDDLARALVASVEEAGKRIFDGAQKERTRRGMGTTATVSVLMDKVLFLAEVGDSRGYLLRGGVLKQLTKDQSLVNQLIEAGHLTEAEAEAFEHSNIILQALGTSETVQVDLTFVELRKGDRLMMCSDGLSGLVHADTICDALSTIEDPSECTKTLIKYAEAGGGHDNITVIVIDFDGDALDAASEADSFGYNQYPLMPMASTKEVFGDEEVTDSGSITAQAARTRKSPLPESMLGDESNSDRSSWLWLAAGVCVLLLGAWVLASSGSGSSAEPASALAAQQVVPKPAAPAEVAEAPEPQPVAVRVLSDVPGATLLVNGEARGRLSAGQSTDMALRPGAYRFEAQSEGNIAAVEVVTVRPDVPLVVNLRLPTGSGGSGDHAAKPGEAVEAVEPGEPGIPSEAAAAPKAAAPKKLPEPAAQKIAEPGVTGGEPKQEAAPAAKKKPVATDTPAGTDKPAEKAAPLPPNPF